ncbi:MAG: flippase-like domain-containing protein [Thermoanaerobacteraceae bacterium]|nr:flippase-like domain-containing protein [Thermoanaerobacteraceae bacterium]
MALLNKKNLIWLLLSVLISFLTVFVIIYFTVTPEEIDEIKHLDIRYILLMILMMFCTWIVDTLRVHNLLSIMGERISFFYLLVSNIASHFIGAITPFQSGALPALVYYLSRRNVKLNKGIIAVTGRLLYSLLFFGIFPLFLTVFFFNRLGLNIYLRILAIGASLFLFLLLLGCWYLMVNPHFVELLTVRIGYSTVIKRVTFKRSRDKWIWRIIKEIKEYNKNFKIMLSYGTKVTIIQFAYTVMFWFIFFNFATVLMKAMGFSVDWFNVLARQTIFYSILTYNPIPSGSGVVELGYAAIFANMVPTSFLGIFVGMWRFFSFYMYVIVSGIIFSLTLKHLGRPQNF